jgi:ABC-type spermidine/putrescine transport system permease subunit II
MAGERTAFDRPRTLWVVTCAVMVLLYLPLAVVFLYSFNSSDSLVQFEGFSLRWYRSVLDNGEMLASLRVSVEVALLSTVVSVVLGTLLSFGIVRAMRVLGRPAQASVFLRVVTPETATGVALLLMFTQLGFTLSRATLVLAHIALTIAFVAVVVTSRLTALNHEVEEAAMDLGATRLQSVWLVAVPALRPAIVASALLAFVLSFDNFITSFFTTGIGVPPLPVRIYSMVRYGVSPEVNAIGALMFVITVAVIVLAMVTSRLASRRRAPALVQKEMGHV